MRQTRKKTEEMARPDYVEVAEPTPEELKQSEKDKEAAKPKKKDKKKDKKKHKTKAQKKKEKEALLRKAEAEERRQKKLQEIEAKKKAAAEAKKIDSASFEEKIAKQMEKLKSSVGAIKRGGLGDTSRDLMETAKNLFSDRQEGVDGKKRDIKAEDKADGIIKKVASHSSLPDTQCKICKESFINTIMLKKHMQKHEDDKKPKVFPCTWPGCGLVCHDAGKLRRHYITHTGEKPYKCDICFKTFGLEYNMKIHRRIHSGEKPFKCTVCGKSFAQKSNLNFHINTHLAPGKRQEEVCLTMEKQGIVPCGLNSYYKKKMRKFMEQRRQGIKPVFSITRHRARLPTTGLSYNDAVMQEPKTGEIKQLSQKRFFLEMLRGIRDEVRSDYTKYVVADAERTKLSSIIERDFETEYLQIQSYQGVVGQIYQLEQLQQESEKLSIVFDELSERHRLRSRKVLGQTEFPCLPCDDVIQVKEEEVEASKKPPAATKADDHVKTEE